MNLFPRPYLTGKWCAKAFKNEDFLLFGMKPVVRKVEGKLALAARNPRHSTDISDSELAVILQERVSIGLRRRIERGTSPPYYWW